MSATYRFLLNMWISKRIDLVFLDNMVTNDKITVEDKELIVATPQV